MKFTTTTISFALLCSLLSVDTASAGMGFSFGNLLFALHICHLPGPKCHLKCDGLLRPKFCDDVCDDSSSNRRLDGSESGAVNWSEAACESLGSSSSDYQKCLDGARSDCNESDIDSEYSYSDASDYAADYVEGDVNSSNGGIPVASRMSFLPYVVAASVATMFLILYAWKKRVSNVENLIQTRHV